MISVQEESSENGSSLSQGQRSIGGSFSVSEASGPNSVNLLQQQQQLNQFNQQHNGVDRGNSFARASTGKFN